MIILQFKHPNIDLSENSLLTAQANSGDTTLSVVDIDGFAVNQILLLGMFGDENSEIINTHATAAPSGTTITLVSGLLYNHTTDTPITIMDYNQIEISRATAKGGSYSVIDTVSITPDVELGTTYKDSNGTSTSYYKIRYKNSITSAYSGYSAEIPATGYGGNTFSGMIDQVLKLFSKQSDRVFDRDDIKAWLNEGYQDMVGQIIDLDIGFYVKYGTDGNGALIPFVANQRAYALPSDFVKSRRLRFSYDNVNFYLADPTDPTMDYPQNVYIHSDPQYYYEGKNVIPLPLPTSSVGGILPLYYYMPAEMANDDDVPDLPIGRYQKNITNYALKRAFESDNKFDVATYYETLFNNRNEAMLNEIKKRSPELPQFVDMWGADTEQDLYDGFTIPLT